MSPIKIEYYSDILCIWAYVTQLRIEKLIETFGDRIEITAYACSVFPDAHEKIALLWQNRGGFEGYGAHVRSVAEKFPHIEVHSDVWNKTVPRTSAAAHLFVKAVEIIEADLDRNDMHQKPYLEKLSSWKPGTFQTGTRTGISPRHWASTTGRSSARSGPPRHWRGLNPITPKAWPRT